jgi:hypothetical protein
MSTRMTDEEAMDLLGNVPICMWTGLAPCPHCNGDHGDPACSKEHDELLRLQLAAGKFAGYALTCRLHNQAEWMEGLVEHINKMAEIIGDSSRFAFDGDGIRGKRTEHRL